MQSLIAALVVALALVALSPAAQARRSSTPGFYKTTCYSAECYDRYHAPRERAPRGSGGSRSHRSRY